MKTLYVHLGSSILHPIIPVKNESVPITNKPLTGGLWACEYTPGEEFRSEWERWCENEGFRTYSDNQGFLFMIKDTARVLYISRMSDYDALPKKYKTGLFLNWEGIAEDYDAVEVYVHSSAHRYFTAWNVNSIIVFREEAIELL